LWRLQAGELPPTLQSKVFWVLIGTNDLAHSECYDDAVYMGIIGVVEYIQQQRPGSIIVVNSLLPRRDATLVDEVKFYDTNKIPYVTEVPQFKIWKSIKNVNQKLRQYCEQNKRNKKILFFDATDIFLKKDDSGVEYIPRNLMWDFLHPSVAGYRAWAEKITDVLSELLEEKDQSEMTTTKEKSVMKEADENQ
jgi:lysophospholipase L1-like esterase